MDERQLLEGAKAELRKGWCKNRLEDDGGNVCIIGALFRVESGSSFDRRWCNMTWNALNHLDEIIPGFQGGTVGYNNTRDNAQEVINLINRRLAQLSPSAIPVPVEA